LGMFLGKSSVGGSLMSATKNNSCMPESDVCTRGSAERKSIGSSEKRQRKERSKKVVKDVEKYSNDGLHRIRRNPAQQKSGKSVEQAGKETCFDGSESENYKEDIKTEKNRQGMMRIRKAPKTMRKLDIDIPGNASQDELPHYSALAVRNERRSSQKSYIIKKLKRRKLKHRSSKRKRVQLTEIDDDDNDIDEDCSFGGNEFGDELEKNAMLTDDEKAMDCFEKGEVSRSTTDSLISDSKDESQHSDDEDSSSEEDTFEERRLRRLQLVKEDAEEWMEKQMEDEKVLRHGEAIDFTVDSELSSKQSNVIKDAAKETEKGNTLANDHEDSVEHIFTSEIKEREKLKTSLSKDGDTPNKHQTKRDISKTAGNGLGDTDTVTNKLIFENAFGENDVGIGFREGIKEELKVSCAMFGVLKEIYIHESSILVSFSSENDAKRCKEALHGRWFYKRNLDVQFFHEESSKSEKANQTIERIGDVISVPTTSCTDNLQLCTDVSPLQPADSPASEEKILNNQEFQAKLVKSFLNFVKSSPLGKNMSHFDLKDVVPALLSASIMRKSSRYVDETSNKSQSVSGSSFPSSETSEINSCALSLEDAKDSECFVSSPSSSSPKGTRPRCNEADHYHFAIDVGYQNQGTESRENCSSQEPQTTKSINLHYRQPAFLSSSSHGGGNVQISFPTNCVLSSMKHNRKLPENYFARIPNGLGEKDGMPTMSAHVLGGVPSRFPRISSGTLRLPIGVEKSLTKVKERTAVQMFVQSCDDGTPIEINCISDGENQQSSTFSVGSRDHFYIPPNTFYSVGNLGSACEAFLFFTYVESHNRI